MYYSPRTRTRDITQALHLDRRDSRRARSKLKIPTPNIREIAPAFGKRIMKDTLPEPFADNLSPCSTKL